MAGVQSRYREQHHVESSREAYLNLQVVVISPMVALPQVLLVEHHTVYRLPWPLHIAAVTIMLARILAIWLQPTNLGYPGYM